MKTTIKQFLAVTGTILFITGCVTTPKLTKPAIPVPSTLPSGEAYQDTNASKDALSVKDIKWQDVFPDQKMKKVIELSLKNNRDIKLAALNTEYARAAYGIQEANLYPAFSTNVTGAKSRVPEDLSSTGHGVISKKYSINMGISSWEIDLFGRVKNLNEQALEKYLGIEETKRGTQTSIISSVVQIYLTLATYEENLKLAKSTLENQEKIHGIVQQLFDNGLSTQVDVQQSQTQIDSAKADIIRYTKSIAQTKNALNLIAGETVPDDLLPKDLADVTPIKDISPGLSSEVLLRRPDIMAAEHQLKGANALISAARKAFFPSISLTTLIGTASANLNGLFRNGSGTWTLTPQLDVPIFDPRTGAAYKATKVQREIYVTEYEKTIQTAFKEVADSLAERGTIDGQINAQQAIINSLQKVYDLSNQRYTQGIDSYLSVLDAQRSLYAAQQQMNALRLTKLNNQASLYAVLGGDEIAKDTTAEK